MRGVCEVVGALGLTLLWLALMTRIVEHGFTWAYGIELLVLLVVARSFVRRLGL